MRRRVHSQVRLHAAVFGCLAAQAEAAAAPSAADGAAAEAPASSAMAASSLGAWLRPLAGRAEEEAAAVEAEGAAAEAFLRRYELGAELLALAGPGRLGAALDDATEAGHLHRCAPAWLGS
jgi:hypothetical protein